MTERLLQYIWQFQYFNKTDLYVFTGEKLLVINPGSMNRNQGPDFLEGRIRIDGQVWVGNIELHTDTSGWRKHAHQHDANYQNVILHVVWNNDDAELAASIPTLVLAGRVAGILLSRYESWMHSSTFIPCGKWVAQTSELTWSAWMQRLAAERLERRFTLVTALLESNHLHWEQTIWCMLARTMGLHVNADAFEEIAQSIPYPVLMRHRTSIQQLECLLLGQAGLLEGEFQEEYAALLQNEFHFFRAKYSLKKINLPVHFLRMRPAGFPTIRLAQLAMIMHQNEKLFATILLTREVKKIRALFDVAASEFWNDHFLLTEKSVPLPKTLGASMITSIMVNTVAPVLFAYGSWHNDEELKARALTFLEELAGELNLTVREFTKLGIKNKNALVSQALLELKSRYCDHKKCLDCSVGYALLKGK